MGQRGKKKGCVKTGGRVKGSLNKVTLREYLAQKNVSVIDDFLRNIAEIEAPATSEALGEFMQVKRLNFEKQSKAADLRAKLMDFIYPKPRIDMSVQVTELSDEELTQEAVRRLNDKSAT